MTARDEEIAALRQRAERAEREFAIERSASGGARADASHMKTQLDAALARIAELEASREQASDPAEYDALLRDADYWSSGMLALGTTGSIIKRLATIVRASPRRTPPCEPGADVVEMLAKIARQAGDSAGTWDAQSVLEAEVRAVLTHLAAMGEEAWPTNEQVYYAWFVNSVREFEGHTDHWTPHIERVRELFRVSTAPVLGALRARVATLEDGSTLTVRAYLDHSSGPLDARHTVKLTGETATVEETWHGADGSETKRYVVRLPLVSLVHLALNTTPDERAAIEARTDWRGVDAPGGEES